MQNHDLNDPVPADTLADDADDERQSLVFTVGPEESGRRLDVAAAEIAKTGDLTLSRTRLKQLIEAGCLTIDEMAVRDAGRKLKAGEVVALFIPPAVDPAPQGESLPLVVVFEDAHLIVIDKPAGLVVHPAPGHASGTLVNALIARCGDSLSGIGGVRRPGIVHRLDKDTSGLLVVAKTDVAHQGLATLFADHGRTLGLRRTYTALVWGELDRPSGTVDAPLGRHPTDRLRMAIVPEARGRTAITHWRVESSYREASRIACDLETGRTHQIRVHLAHLGHPVVGDPLYGKGFRTKSSRLPAETRTLVDGLPRQALHATTLGFIHPVTGKGMLFKSDLPPELTALQTALANGPIL